MRDRFSRNTTAWCAKPNNGQIAARAVRAIDHHGGYADTSVWLDRQRRWVRLKGCVPTAQQATALDHL